VLGCPDFSIIDHNERICWSNTFLCLLVSTMCCFLVDVWSIVRIMRAYAFLCLLLIVAVAGSVAVHRLLPGPYLHCTVIT
jgi:hypothetical protein